MVGEEGEEGETGEEAEEKEEEEEEEGGRRDTITLVVRWAAQAAIMEFIMVIEYRGLVGSIKRRIGSLGPTFT